jgi:hypothetical protein
VNIAHFYRFSPIVTDGLVLFPDGTQGLDAGFRMTERREVRSFSLACVIDDGY